MLSELPSEVERDLSESITKVKGKSGLSIFYKSQKDYEKVLQLWSQRETVRMKNGLPIRLTGRFTCHVSMHQALACAVRQLLDNAVQNLPDGVKCYFSKSNDNAVGGVRKVVLQLQATSMTALNASKNLIHKSLICNAFKSEDIKLLFSPGARQRMKELSSCDDSKPCSEQFYLHWDIRSKEILVYGSIAQREHGLAALSKLVEDLKSIYVGKTMCIKQSSRKLVRLLIATIKGWSGVQEVVLQGLTLHVLAEQDALEKILDELSVHWDLQPKTKGGECKSTETQCSLCYCELAEDNHELLACGCKSCTECLDNQFHGALAGDGEYLLPVRCGFCRAAWAFADIVMTAPAQALLNLKAISIENFVTNSNGGVKHCVVPGCNQFIKFESANRRNDEGGCVVYCDQCTISYCYDCSDKLGMAVAEHGDYTCEEFVKSQNPTTITAVRHITDNILLNKCPHCKLAFFDFTGCFALACTCKGYFCGYCLKPFPDSTATHSHVLRCELGNSQFFNHDPMSFMNCSVKRWTVNLLAYLKTLPVDTRIAVVEAAAVHLEGAGIRLKKNLYC